MERRAFLKGAGALTSTIIGGGCVDRIPVGQNSSGQAQAPLNATTGEPTAEEERIAELEEKLDELESELAAERRSSDRLAAEKAELEDQLRAERRRVGELRDELEAKEERIAALENGSDEAALQEQIDEYEARIEALESDVAYYKSRAEETNIWGFTPDQLESLQRVADRWRGATVFVEAFASGGRRWGGGTGWLFDETVIATNAHVIQDEDGDVDVDRYRLWTIDGEQRAGTHLGHTFGNDDVFDNQEDIGFLGLEEAMADAEAMSRGTSEDLTRGDPLVQIGHPRGLPFWTASAGPYEKDGVGASFVSNIPAGHGSSGSPVLDIDGQVVGMTWGRVFTDPRPRDDDGAPEPGDNAIRTSFEEADTTYHNRIERIETAANELIE